jgi:hypothetical protein
MTVSFTGDENDPGVRRARLMGYSERLGWKFAGPIAFVDSQQHPAIQLADIIAGTTVAVVSKDFPPELSDIGTTLGRHLLQDTVLPDMDVVNPENRSARVNSIILYGLATRAERQANPYEALREIYHTAEVAFACGELRL